MQLAEVVRHKRTRKGALDETAARQQRWNAIVIVLSALSAPYKFKVKQPDRAATARQDEAEDDVIGTWP